MDDEILIIDEKSLREKIYVVRGVQVMLDFDLAQIYGYRTAKLNEQVKNNIDRFMGDEFMFKLTDAEFNHLMSKNRTASWGGRRNLPYAFTEQGIYMLMTVLKGELAVKQSRQLVRLFKQMKDFFSQGHSLIIRENYLNLLEKVEKHSMQIKATAGDIKEMKQMMVTHADLSDFMKIFNESVCDKEILILDGQPFKADLAYQKIYGNAKKSVVVIDDYIGIKTLKNLVHAKENVELIIVSNNKGNKPLRLSEYNDFCAEYPERSVTFLQSAGRTHDRYIVLDEGTRGMKVYHCGASSKDAGKRVTTITRIGDVKEYKVLVQELLGNPELVLK